MTAPSFFEKNFEKQEGIFENLLTYQQVCGILRLVDISTSAVCRTKFQTLYFQITTQMKRS